MTSTAVRVERRGPIYTVILHRPERRNAIDHATAQALSCAFRDFDADPEAAVAVLFGDGGQFCAGADLKAVAAGQLNRLEPAGDGPLGPTRLRLHKPVIAAIAGHAVAGGLELALWCDLRVAESDATLGVYCRRVGVPLIDGGTVRLPQLIGRGRALDLILTGRAVGAAEALAMGLVDRVVPPGGARAAAEALASELSALPQGCLRSDRAATLDQLESPLPLPQALEREFAHGLETLKSGESLAGAARFSSGAFRHGERK